MDATETSQRQRRRNNTPTIALRTLGTVATTALVLYGTYEALRWVWKTADADANSDATGTNTATPPTASTGTSTGSDLESTCDNSDTTKRQSSCNNHTSTKTGTNGSHSRPNTTPPPVDADSNNYHASSQVVLQHQQRKLNETMQSTFQAMWPLLRRRVDELTNVSSERKQLRNMRAHASISTIGNNSSTNGTDDTNGCGTPHDRHNMQQQQQDVLWMKIQIESLTKWIATTYAYTMLYTLLTIQGHLLLGHQYRRRRYLSPTATTNTATTPTTIGQNHVILNRLDDIDDVTEQTSNVSLTYAPTTTPVSPIGTTSTNSSMTVTHDTLDEIGVLHRTYDYFWEHGLTNILIPSVRRAVTVAVSDWHLTATAGAVLIPAVAPEPRVTRIDDAVEVGYMTESKFRSAIDQIRRQIEQTSLHPPVLMTCLISPDDNNNNNASTTAVSSQSQHDSKRCPLLDETYDLLESPLVQDALADGLNAVFHRMQLHSWAPLFAALRLPLAPVIAHTKPVTNSLFSTESRIGNAHTGTPCETNYMALLQQVPTLQEAARVSFGD